MARLVFFGRGGRVGRGKISVSAGVATAESVEASVSLSWPLIVLVEAATTAFCEFLSGLLDVFLGAGSVSAMASAVGGGADADCAWAGIAEAVVDGAGADLAVAFSIAVGEAFATVSLAGFSGFTGGASEVVGPGGGSVLRAAASAAAEVP